MSDCVVNKYLPTNMFSDEYSQYKCQQDCVVRQIYTECRALPYEYRRYYKNATSLEPDRFLRMINNFANSCVKSWYWDIDINIRHSRQERIAACLAGCPKPCTTTKYSATVSTQKKSYNTKDTDTEIMILYDELAVETHEEYFAYSFETFYCNMCGIIGMMTGMSVFSLCEFVICALCFFGESFLLLVSSIEMIRLRMLSAKVESLPQPNSNQMQELDTESLNDV